MNLLPGLETFLYVISSALFFPVVAGLVLLTFWILILLGGFIQEWVERRRGESSVLAAYKNELERTLASTDNNADIVFERLLQVAELDVIKSLDRIRFVIRTGPALGLMGTLIPMGISLSALAKGDMPQMASNMVTAFTTTIVGLAASVIAYLMSLVKEKWMRADIREMEYHTEMALRSRGRYRAAVKNEEAEDDDIS